MNLVGGWFDRSLDRWHRNNSLQCSLPCVAKQTGDSLWELYVASSRVRLSGEVVVAAGREDPLCYCS